MAAKRNMLYNIDVEVVIHVKNISDLLDNINYKKWTFFFLN